MKIRSISLPDELDQQVMRAAGKQPYSAFVRDLLENSLTGEKRQAALNAVASAELQEYADANGRERGPNATEIIAEASTEGHARLRALEKLAKATR